MESRAAHFRFYAELNDFLPPARRQVRFRHAFGFGTSVKDAIEALGVPHPEVDLILVDGQPVGFAHPLPPGADVSVYPVFEALDVAPLQRLRPTPLREPRFVVDGHLGKLARDLRLLGFDTWYRPAADDATLAAVSHDEHRILLTRDLGLLKRNAVTHGIFVRATAPDAQLREVLARLQLAARAKPLTRCTACNALLQPVPFSDVAATLPPKVRARAPAVQRCPGCARLYWEGTHTARMRARMASLLR